MTNFVVGTSTTDWIETLDSGAARTNDRSASVLVNGSFADSLTDEFQTYNPMIDGTGSVLTLTFVMGSTVGSYGGMGMDNLVLNGSAIPEPATLGLIGVLGIGFIAIRRFMLV